MGYLWKWGITTDTQGREHQFDTSENKREKRSTSEISHLTLLDDVND